jgi:hypothetical protein
MTRKRSLFSADMAVLRAAATSSLIRLVSSDGADEAADMPLTVGVGLATFLISNSGPLKPKP